jgi:hypothetical protein
MATINHHPGERTCIATFTAIDATDSDVIG